MNPLPVRRKKHALRRFFLRPKVLLCLALALFAAAFLIVDQCVFPMRYAAALMRLPAIPAREEGQMRVLFADVGQGDCTVIQFPDGTAMLIDGGDGSLSARSEAIACCFALGVERFDSVLLTHPDSDHAAGLAELIACFGADTVWLPLFAEAEGEDGAAYAAVLSAVEESGAETRFAQTYAHFLSSEEEYFYYGMFLSPSEGESYADTNDASAVLWLEYAGKSFLFTGDASGRVEDALVRAYEQTDGAVFELDVPAYGGTRTLAPALSELTFLKAGHHGSNASTGEALLSLCSPDAVFFSAGRGNLYGHPSDSCIARVREAVPDAALYRTDELGSILLTLSADGSCTVQAV